MKICTASASFRSCNLLEAVEIARALGFNAIDLDGTINKHISREKILEVSGEEIKRLKSMNITFPDLAWTFEEFSFIPAINDPDPTIRNVNKDMFQKVVEFCHEAEIHSILLLPGVLLPGQSQADAHRLSAQVLNEYLPIAKEAEVILHVEPHVSSSFESPQSVLWLLEQVPGLKIVLDYSHFVCQGYPQPALDPLIPHTSHVHLRQAKSGLLQTKLEDGTINFALILDQLQHVGYGEYLCVEYVHQDYIGADNVDVITETIKMRDLVKSLIDIN